MKKNFRGSPPSPKFLMMVSEKNFFRSSWVFSKNDRILESDRMSRTIDILKSENYAETVTDRIRTALNERDRSNPFHLFLSGGSTPKVVYAGLADSGIDWAGVHLWWGDERFVPPDHADSNFRMVKEQLLEKVSIPEKQACAAIGQSFLMHTYEKAFEKKNIKVAQILLSHDDLGNRSRYLNAKNTIEALLNKRVIPIINENDSVTVEEIKIGDNDTLSATVACLVDAQLLIILSDVEGLYNRDPSFQYKGEKAKLISHVERVNEEIERTAGKSKNRLTVGGMYTKVLAAKKTMSFGIPTLVVNGLDRKVLEKIFSGKDVGTLFWSGKGKIRNRKHWIAHTLKPAGTVVVDAGAKKALVERGKSLLPAGLIKIKGKFEFGKAVMISDEAGKEIGRGLVNYSSSDLQQIKGMKTSAIKKSIGESFYEEVIHRDDLVIF